MVKYTDTQIVFREVPDEITLAVNISGCPNHCVGCHSSYLAEDIGEKLTFSRLFILLDSNPGITCMSFMGGDQDPKYINLCAAKIKEKKYPIKVAWYSGKQSLDENISLCNFDYIKLGPFIPERGPLNNPNTNQKLYEVLHEYSNTGNLEPKHRLSNITYKFWNDKN